MDLVAAATFLTVSEADVACSALRSASIDATVAGHVGSSVARRSDRLPELQLLVPEDQLDDARAILAQFEPAPTPAPAQSPGDRLANLAPILAVTALVVVAALAWAIWSQLRS
jgi:hypothetical protein